MNAQAKRKGSEAGDKEADSQNGQRYPPQPQYSSQQLQAVQRVLKLSRNNACLYDILDVPTDASEGEIQKAVKALALKIHPDKNPAPGATKAMEIVFCAREVLLDPQNRLEYDRRRGRQPEMTLEETFSSFLSPDSLSSLEKAMPWLAVGAGLFLVGAGAYALYNAHQEGSANKKKKVQQ